MSRPPLTIPRRSGRREGRRPSNSVSEERVTETKESYLVRSLAEVRVEENARVGRRVSTGKNNVPLNIGRKTAQSVCAHPGNPRPEPTLVPLPVTVKSMQSERRI